MADHIARIFCENPQKNQFSAKIVAANFRKKIRDMNFRRKFMTEAEHG